MSDPLVSAVVTTIGRPAVIEAIDSVRHQTFPGPIELVVIADRPVSNMPKEVRTAIASADKIIETTGQRGAPHARNLGVANATGDVIAFLDDDDLWNASKISEQIKLFLASGGGPAVISSRIRQAINGEDAASDVTIPAELYRTSSDRRVEDYLFANRAASIRRPSLYTSTLLVDKTTALTVPWREDLPRHQDWDWLMRLERAGACIEQSDLPLVTIRMNSLESISSTTNWETSLAWIGDWKGEIATQTHVDFVAAQPLRYALMARSLNGCRQSLLAIARARRLPRLQPLAIGLSGLVPRRLLSRTLLRRRRTLPRP